MGLKEKTFEILDHTADLGIRVSGENLENLFQNAAHAMMRIILDKGPQQPGSITELSVKGADLPDLMVRWLGEILYLFEGENRVVTRTKICHITSDHLDARIETIPYASNRHEILTEIKAVTYHQIDVIRSKTGVWNARIIFDL